jgi:hypothetical protein
MFKKMENRVQKLSSKLSSTLSQQKVKTMGGEWKTKIYRVVKKLDVHGAEIELEFVPNKLVDSSKIALFQKIERKFNGNNPDQELADKWAQGGTFLGHAERTRASRSNGRGHWDTDNRTTNPVYGAGSLGSSESVSATPDSNLDMSNSNLEMRSNYQLGNRQRLHSTVRSAKLYDRATVPGNAKTGSEMIFETTAMSLEGPQKNVYYGSVRWGWRINRNITQDQSVSGTDIELEPLAVVSMGTPSTEMKDLTNVEWH